MVPACSRMSRNFYPNRPPMNTIAFRPRKATEIIDTTFRVSRATYPALVTAMIVISAPALILGLFPATAPIAGLVQNLVFTVADGAIIAIVSAAYLGQRPDAGTGLRALSGRIWPLLGAAILRNLLIIAGLILLVIPGLVAIVVTFAVPMAIVIEDRPVGESFSRSRRLSEGYVWHVVRTLLLLALIVFGLIFGLAAMFGIATEMLGVSERLGDLVVTVVMILVYPLFSVGGTLLYYDLRIRTEGFDLEMMLQGLGGPDPSVTGATAPVPSA